MGLVKCSRLLPFQVSFVTILSTGRTTNIGTTLYRPDKPTTETDLPSSINTRNRGQVVGPTVLLLLWDIRGRSQVIVFLQRYLSFYPRESVSPDTVNPRVGVIFECSVILCRSVVVPTVKPGLTRNPSPKKTRNILHFVVGTGDE